MTDLTPYVLAAARKQRWGSIRRLGRYLGLDVAHLRALPVAEMVLAVSRACAARRAS